MNKMKGNGQMFTAAPSAEVLYLDVENCGNIRGGGLCLKMLDARPTQALLLLRASVRP